MRDIPAEERRDDVEQVASRVQRVKRAVCEVEVEIAKGDHGCARVICTGVDKRVVPRLRETRLRSPDSLWPRGASSRNLGTTLFPSPVKSSRKSRGKVRRTRQPSILCR